MREASKTRECGAAIVEAALVIGLLITFLIAIMEVARFHAVKAWTQRAAKQGLELAIRHDDLLIDKVGSEDPLVNAAFEEVEHKVLSFPMGSAVLAKVISALGGTRNNSCLVLRPGEGGEYEDPLDPGKFVAVEHPTYPKRVSGDKMMDLLRAHPILVEVNASMHSLLPFIGDIPIRVQAIGMAEIPPVGIEGLPGSPIPPLPQCGNGIWEPDFGEECEYKGQLGVDLLYECKMDCKKQLKCGNGVLNREAGEECDKANPSNTGGQTCAAYFASGNPQRAGCNSQCLLYLYPKCGNYCIDPGEPCDIYASKTDNTTIGTMAGDEGCYKPRNAGLLTPCRAAKIVDCPGGKNLVVIPCPPDSSPSWVCYECVGDGGACPPPDVFDPKSPCRPGSTSPLVDYPEYCDNCHRIVDLCGNGHLGDWPGEECEGSQKVNGTMSPGEYCTASCKVASKCGNGKIDSGEQCDPGAAFDWTKMRFGGAPCDSNCTCATDCTVTRPNCDEPGRTNCPPSYEAKIKPASNPVSCLCCPTMEGVTACVPPLS